MLLLLNPSQYQLIKLCRVHNLQSFIIVCVISFLWGCHRETETEGGEVRWEGYTRTAVTGMKNVVYLKDYYPLQRSAFTH